MPTSPLFSPLRLRLLGLVAVASVPAAFFIARLAVRERTDTFARTRDSAERLLDSALVEQQGLLRTGSELAQALVRLPDVSSGSSVDCSRLLSLLFRSFPSYTDAERVTPDLRADCSTEAGRDTSPDMSHDVPLVLATKTGRRVSGYYRRGRHGDMRASTIEPIRDPAGAIRFYLEVDVGLSWLDRLAAQAAAGPGTTVSLTSGAGSVLARLPDPAHLAGERLPPNEAFSRMVAQKTGYLEGTDVDGARKLFVFRELPAANESPVLLSIALPIKAVYAEANHNLEGNLLVAVVTLALALLTAWLAADLFVLRDVRALLGATQRIAAGDLTARVPSGSGSGELQELAGTFNNMAERLEERRREFLALGDSSPDAIARIDRDLRIDWANEALLQQLDATPDAVSGMPMESVPAERVPLARLTEQVRETFEAGEPRDVELRIGTAGRETWVDVRSVPERDNSGAVDHVLLTLRDVTSRKQLEAHLAQAARLDSIGKLAGNISHDFNNLVTAIVGNTEMALRTMEPDHRARRDLSEILDVAQRASSLTRQLLSFARRQPSEPRVIDVGPFIEKASPLLRSVLGERVRLELEIDPRAPRIRFDPTHFEQVLVNLATNARDAMPNGGTLTIGASPVSVAAGGVRGPDAPPPGDYLLMRVTDTGVGMSPAVRERIFEPFFTTKENRLGTGLGLAVVYGAMRQHGGFIEVESTEGHGTTFRLYCRAVGSSGSHPAIGRRPVEAAARPV